MVDVDKLSMVDVDKLSVVDVDKLSMVDVDKLSMVDVANGFVFQLNHRETLFRRFDDVDLRRKSLPCKICRDSSEYQ